MFDAYEAIDDLITDININHYNEVCNELLYRVESGEITSEEAQLAADYAYDIFIEKKNKDEEDDEEEKEAKKVKRKKIIKRAAIGAGAAAGVAGAVVGGRKFAKNVEIGYNLSQLAKCHDNIADKYEKKYKHKKDLLRKLNIKSASDLANDELKAKKKHDKATTDSDWNDTYDELVNAHSRTGKRKRIDRKLEFMKREADSSREASNEYRAAINNIPKKIGASKIGLIMYDRKYKR